MKEEITAELREKLTDFELVEGSEQRSVGDLVEYKIKKICEDFAKKNNIKFLDRRSKKSLEDFTLIRESDGKEYIFYFDPKTHDVNADFSMPNLSSVDKLKKLLETDNQNLLNIFIDYNIIDGRVNVVSVDVRYIWELDFSVLRIGSLGKGQLQISDMKKGLVYTEIGRKEWYEKLKLMVNEYHTEQIKRIEKEKIKWLKS